MTASSPGNKPLRADCSSLEHCRPRKRLPRAAAPDSGGRNFENRLGPGGEGASCLERAGGFDRIIPKPVAETDRAIVNAGPDLRHIDFDGDSWFLYVDL